MGRHVTDGTQASLSNPSLQVACGGLAYLRAAQRGFETHPSVFCSPPVTQYTEPEGIENAIAKSLFLF